ncbi:ketoacyl-ACP synthase III [Mammaliicoccus lentus]|uniref:ketoacyl-ACP synthase III n=1 Tax=Mammaliicoccus TaxID=2803850 RepID=UPI0002F6E8D7|nr:MULTISPECIES: ketoacyl-ACP synthase III [Mammaliicoccus]HBV02990.1 ketoacyl-ACP synthase III [Staphylococcus sp.]MBF0749392.1 ketoacyl-ACP synthase III [Mammaliicoccus lentus]MBW0767345.1 ketoacyl-ACP synthase III [Mammaliicoccus lentus]MBW0771130.1 ketoacyl-ACP synthase III [Mammaliicoccus lentus]MCD2477605.1 ketoacyl-ACP synthase III [Mammaliicoccus lentus]
MTHAKITAVGSYKPSKVLTNEDMEQLVETSDDWIISRTGIKERRIAADDEFTSDLCYEAIKNLEKKYNKDISDVDLIIVSTLTPDYRTPSVASYVQGRLGLENAAAIDVNAACAGFVYGINMANAYISSGMYNKIIVVAGEVLSKITDYSDRNTCVLFGDGAGAFLIENDEESSFITSTSGSEGKLAESLYCTDVSKTMFGKDLEQIGFVNQNGKEVYKWAIKMVPREIEKVAEKANVELKDVDWFVPHSANLKMIQNICKRSEYPFEQTLHSLVYYGNTSSATIPLAIDDAVDRGDIKKGETILLFGFGGGLTYSSSLIKWGI